MKRISFVYILLFTFLGGCGSFIHGPPPEKLNLSEGYILISTGRSTSCTDCNANIIGNLPFVTWFLLDYDDEWKDVTRFLPDLGGFGELGEGKYGYTHVEKVRAGRYVLTGSSRAGGVCTYFGFHIIPGRVNYLGELLTVNGNIEHSEAISHSFQKSRDLTNILSRYPDLAQYETINIVPGKNFSKPPCGQ